MNSIRYQYHNRLNRADCRHFPVVPSFGCRHDSHPCRWGGLPKHDFCDVVLKSTPLLTQPYLPSCNKGDKMEVSLKSTLLKL